MTIDPNACTVCLGWLTKPDAATHGPYFPSNDWDIVTSEDITVGPGELAMRGTAKCKGCGRVEAFDCRYPEGYFFPARDWARKAWENAVRGL